jgi:hypothetical protein
MARAPPRAVALIGSGGFGDGRAVWAGVRGRRVPLEDVPRSRDAFVEHAWVDRRPVGHDLDRNRSEPHRAGEERTRRGAVSASRDQDIDDLAVLIDRAVEAGCSSPICARHRQRNRHPRFFDVKRRR